ncbi:MAG: DUF402 domain-containing protein [Lachnospiraceae bacterium]|nr:DUF402 domain-containing protein [Lachnospiraceae bacterium]
MKRKRLDRDKNWGFQHFPYYQMRVDMEGFHGLASLIDLVDGEYFYWDYPKAGKAAVCGKGMKWLQLVPDDRSHMITVKYLPQSKMIRGEKLSHSVSVWYVDIIEGIGYAEDGVAIFVDKYLDVIFTPQGDVVVDDRDELDAAYSSGELTKEQYEGALREGDLVVKELCTDVEATELYCAKILEYLLEKIQEGEAPYDKKHNN